MSKHEDFGKYLAEKYSRIFSKPLYVGTSEGWFDIIDRLSKEIADNAEKFPHNSIAVVQIKEKFGGLRYYMDYENMSDDDIYAIEQIVRRYENESHKTCEDCSKEGSMCSPRHYWMRTLCDECRNKYDMGETPNGQ